MPDKRIEDLANQIKEFQKLPKEEKTKRLNEAIAVGKILISYDPVAQLEHLIAIAGYSPAVGHFVPLDPELRKRIQDVIKFNRGKG